MLLLTPFLLPYYQASADVGLGRSLEETQRFSAELTDYAAAAGRIHFDVLQWSRLFFQGDALFPGFVALVLAGIGLASFGVRDMRTRMLVAIAVVSFALSFGPAFPPYRVLYRIYPLLTGIRGAVRFGQFTLIAIGMLSGFGIAALQRRLRSPVATPVCLACVLLVNGEAMRAPMGYSEYLGTPPVLRRTEAAAVEGSAGVLSVLRLVALPPERAVHAGECLDADVPPDAERLLRVQAGQLLRAREAARVLSRIRRRSTTCAGSA